MDNFGDDQEESGPGKTEFTEAVLSIAQDGKIICEPRRAFLYFGGDIRCVYAHSSPQHAAEFLDCDVTIRPHSTRTCPACDAEPSVAGHQTLSPSILVETTEDIIGEHSGYSDCAMWIHGNVTLYRSEPEESLHSHQVEYRIMCRAVLVARSKEERNAWLLAVRVCLVPSRVLLTPCLAHTSECAHSSCRYLRSVVEFNWQRIHAQIAPCSVIAEPQGAGMIEPIDLCPSVVPTVSPSGEEACGDPRTLHAIEIRVMNLSIALRSVALCVQGPATLESARGLEDICASALSVVSSVEAVLSAPRTSVGNHALSEVVNTLFIVENALTALERSIFQSGILHVSQGLHKKAIKLTARRLQVEAEWASTEEICATRPEAHEANYPVTPNQDGFYRPAFMMNIPPGLLNSKAGSPGIEYIIQKVLQVPDTRECLGTTVIAVHGEPGCGKTTTCLLALADSRVKEAFPEGVLRINVGVNLGEEELINRIAGIIELCNGVGTARRIRASSGLREAALSAMWYFRNRRIVLLLDDLWPGQPLMKWLAPIACGPGSCVVFTTRSTRLASAHATFTVALRALDLNDDSQRLAGREIFTTHLQHQRDNPSIDDALAEKVLSVARGLPLSIATLAVLVRERLAAGLDTTSLHEMFAAAVDVAIEGPDGLVHRGLLAATAETVEFLDGRRHTEGEPGSSSRDLLKFRLAAICVLDCAHRPVPWQVLEYLWETSPEDVEQTVTDFADMGLVQCEESTEESAEIDHNGNALHTVSMGRLQELCCARLCDEHQHGITIPQAHEMVLKGMFPLCADLDSPDEDLNERCRALLARSQAHSRPADRYRVSHLVRHLIGSLTRDNAIRRWPTIRRLLSDPGWMLQWQSVDGRATVMNMYANLSDAMSSRWDAFEVRPDAEIAAIAALADTVRDD